MSNSTPILSSVDDDAEVRDLYPLMAQLRPHLRSEDDFLARWKRQSADGYRLVALFENGRPQAVAGFRMQENLVHGRFLYVDDLVTDHEVRGRGYGERLITYLRGQACELGCSKMILDTPLSNSLGHRFYFRCGMLATSLRFAIEA